MPYSSRLPHENAPALVMLRPLTKARLLGHAGLPLTLRGVASAFPAFQESGKVLPHILSSTSLPTIRVAGDVHILAGYDVRESVRPRRLRKGRGTSCPAFFVALNFARYPMTNNTPSTVNGPELTTATSTAAACRRAFRRKSALRLPEDRTELPSLPEDFATMPEADRPEAAPTLHDQAVAARDALQRAAAGLTAYRQAVADALLPRICGPEGNASANVRPFIADVLEAKFYDLGQQLTNAHDAALGQAALLCRLARELEKEVRHA